MRHSPTNAVTRRQALAMLAASQIVIPPPPPDWLGAVAARAKALQGPGLIQSYDVAGDAPFDVAHGNCAYVYDNAVAGLALLAGGRTELARRIGDALVMAQANDRFWKDGRFRNAYKSGPAPAVGTYPLPGWWNAGAARWTEDAYQVGTATGVVGWAMLLLLALHRATGDARYLASAGHAGDWVVRATRVTRGFSGGFLGFEPGPERLGWVSTEHNLDLAVAFAGLGRTDAAAHARDFVGAMWNARAGRFMTGLTPDGSVNPLPAVDANIWPLLAPGAEAAWAPALAWVAAHLGVPPLEPAGVDFNDDRDGIWLEGTAFMVLAAQRARQTQISAPMMATLRAQTSPDGLVWACTVPRLTTGLSTGLTDDADFFYYRRGALAPTAWAALAAMGRSPFDE